MIPYDANIEATVSPSLFYYYGGWVGYLFYIFFSLCYAGGTN